MGWTRELWMESLGMPAVLPPPEEQKDVKTAIGAARAKNARDDMAKGALTEVAMTDEPGVPSDHTTLSVDTR